MYVTLYCGPDILSPRPPDSCPASHHPTLPYDPTVQFMAVWAEASLGVEWRPNEARTRIELQQRVGVIMEMPAKTFPAGCVCENASIWDGLMRQKGAAASNNCRNSPAWFCLTEAFTAQLTPSMVS